MSSDQKRERKMLLNDFFSGDSLLYSLPDENRKTKQTPKLTMQLAHVENELEMIGSADPESVINPSTINI